MKWLWRILIAFIIVTLSFFIWINYRRTAVQLKAHSDRYDTVVLYIDDRPIESITALLNRDQHIFIDLSMLASYRSEPFQLSETGDRLTVAARQFDRSSSSDLTVDIPLIKFAERNYVDINYLPYISDLSLITSRPPHRLYSKDYSIRYAYTNGSVALRAEPSAFAVQLKALPEMAKVYVISEVVQYYFVRTDDGEQGYIARSALDEIYEMGRSVALDDGGNRAERYGRLQWTFDYFSDYQSVLKSAPIQKIDGLDGFVVNFFDVSDDGQIVNRCDFDYVRRAHRQGYSVQGGVAKALGDQQLHQLLSDYRARQKLAEQLRAYCKLYQLDGISLNFGELDSSDKFNYLQFVKQLYSLLNEEDILLSVSILPNLDDAISHLIDYNIIAKFCDYVLLMAYEEYGADSEVAGSVASLAWTKRQLDTVLANTPNAKVILGIPTYMRVWSDVEGERSHMLMSEDLSQKTMAMNQLMDFLSQRDYTMARDSGSGQNYYEVARGDVTLKVWAEDAHSVKRRLQIVKAHHLAGVISWRKGFESTDFWRVVRENIDD